MWQRAQASRSATSSLSPPLPSALRRVSMLLTPSGSWENHVPGTSHCTFTQAPPLTETPPITPTPLLSGLLLKLQCPPVKSPLSGTFPCPPQGWPSTMLDVPWRRSSTGLIQAWLHFVCLLLCLLSPAKSKLYDAEQGLGFIHFWSSRTWYFRVAQRVFVESIHVRKWAWMCE